MFEPSLQLGQVPGNLRKATLINTYLQQRQEGGPTELQGGQSLGKWWNTLINPNRFPGT